MRRKEGAEPLERGAHSTLEKARTVKKSDIRTFFVRAPSDYLRHHREGHQPLRSEWIPVVLHASQKLLGDREGPRKLIGELLDLTACRVTVALHEAPQLTGDLEGDDVRPRCASDLLRELGEAPPTQRGN